MAKELIPDKLYENFILYDSSGFFNIRVYYKPNLKTGIYKRILKIDIMPPDAEIPKGLLEIILEKGFYKKDSVKKSA